jgi:hypothetical protein
VFPITCLAATPIMGTCRSVQSFGGWNDSGIHVFFTAFGQKAAPYPFLASFREMKEKNQFGQFKNAINRPKK